MTSPNILVTGGNRGLGVEVIRILSARHPQGKILMGCRDPSRGQAAIKDLASQGVNTSNIEAIQCDVSDDASVAKTAEIIKDQYGGKLDTLYANAAIAKADAEGSKGAEQIFNTNYTGVKRIVKHLVPFLPAEGHFIVVSSEVGAWTHGNAPDEVKKRLDDPTTLTIDQLDAMTKEYIAGRGDKPELAAKYPDPTAVFGDYGPSKMFVSAYSRVLARQLKDSKVIVSVVCPGYCSTDMNDKSGPRSAYTGAKSIAQGEKCPLSKTGSFMQDGKQLDFVIPMPGFEEIMANARETERLSQEEDKKNNSA